MALAVLFSSTTYVQDQSVVPLKSFIRLIFLWLIPRLDMAEQITPVNYFLLRDANVYLQSISVRFYNAYTIFTEINGFVMAMIERVHNASAVFLKHLS